MEAVAAVFAYGTLAFYLVLAALFCAIWAAVSKRRSALGLIPLAASIAFLQFVVHLPVWQWLRENWLVAAAWFGIYVGSGFVHLFIRWLLHTTEQKAELLSLRGRFCLSEGISPATQAFTAEQKVKYGRFLKREEYDPNLDEPGDYGDTYDPNRHGMKTTFDRSKYTVTRWLFWWVWCLFGLLDDYIAMLLRVIRENLRGVLNWMSAWVFGNLAADALTEEERRTVGDSR